MIISMIAALALDRTIDKDKRLHSPRVIGSDNSMPWHLPADFNWFKRCTLGKPVIMGRKTYESIGRPLPGRSNLVISRDSKLTIEGVTVVTSIEQALDIVQECEEVMIIGGGSIYQSCLPMAQRLYITFINAEVEGDTHFPDWGTDFVEVSREHFNADDKNEYDMDFCVLERA